MQVYHLCHKHGFNPRPNSTQPWPRWDISRSGFGEHFAKFCPTQPNPFWKWIGFGHSFLTQTWPGCILIPNYPTWSVGAQKIFWKIYLVGYVGYLLWEEIEYPKETNMSLNMGGMAKFEEKRTKIMKNHLQDGPICEDGCVQISNNPFLLVICPKSFPPQILSGNKRHAPWSTHSCNAYITWNDWHHWRM